MVFSICSTGSEELSCCLGAGRLDLSHYRDRVRTLPQGKELVFTVLVLSAFA